jgi:hypothetical protein
LESCEAFGVLIMSIKDKLNQWWCGFTTDHYPRAMHGESGYFCLECNKDLPWTKPYQFERKEEKE